MTENIRWWEGPEKGAQLSQQRHLCANESHPHGRDINPFLRVEPSLIQDSVIMFLTQELSEGHIQATAWKGTVVCLSGLRGQVRVIYLCLFNEVVKVMRSVF